MGQEKGRIEGTGRIQKPGRFLELGALARIGSSLVSLAQVKQQFGGARGLAHRVVLLMRTKVLVLLVYCSCTLLSSFFVRRLHR